MTDKLDDPLVGRWFHTFDPEKPGEEPKILYQGVVKERVSDNVYLVQLHSFIDGSPTTLHIVSLLEMCGAWVFYESDEQMRAAHENRSTRPMTKSKG